MAKSRQEINRDYRLRNLKKEKQRKLGEKAAQEIVEAFTEDYS